MRGALGEARGRLDADDGAVGELVERAGTRVRARGADARADPVEHVLDTGPLRVEPLARRRDALLEQRLAGPVEAAVAAGAGADRALGRHPERLLVRPSGLVAQQVTRRLVGAGQPGPDHRGGRTGGEGERDVTRVPDTAVRPDPHAVVAAGRRALQDGGELRAPDPGHHPRGAHRARADPDLDDVRAGRGEVAHAFRRHDVARDDRDGSVGPASLPDDRPDGPQRVEHLLLVAVRGVDDQHVHTGVEQRLRLHRDITVDADRGGRAEPAAVVDGRGVDLGAHGTERREQAGEPAVGVETERHAARAEGLEHLPRRGVQRQGERCRVEHVGEAGEAVDTGARRLVDGAHRAPGVVDHDHRAVRPLGQQVQHVRDGVAGVQHERGVPDGVPRLDPRDDLGDRLRRDVLRQHGQRPAPRQRLGHPAARDRRHVRRDDGNRGAGTVRGGQVDVEPRGDGRPAGDEEHVVVGEIAIGHLAVEEAHGERTLRALRGCGPMSCVAGRGP